MGWMYEEVDNGQEFHRRWRISCPASGKMYLWYTNDEREVERVVGMMNHAAMVAGEVMGEDM